MVGQAPNTGGDSGAAALDGCWPAVELSPGGAITSANDAFARCVGRSSGELCATPFFDLVHAEDRHRAVALMVAATAQPVELRLVGADGDDRFLLVGPPHSTSRVLLCCDMTQQRRAEQSARKAETAAREDARRYAEVIHSTSDWVWEMDAALRYTYFSANLEKLTSITPASVIGKRREEIADPSLEGGKWAEHAAILQARKAFRDFVYRSTQTDGRLLWIKVSGTPIFAEDGQFSGYRGVATDVTSQLAGERAVAESERRLRQLFEVASDWFWETDADGRFTFLSAAWSQITGQDPAEFLGKRREEFGDRTDDPEAWRQHLAALAARRAFRNFTYCLRSTVGDSRWIRTTGVPVLDEDGRFKGYRGAATDVTAEVEALRDAHAVYERFAEAIENVPVGLVVHDADDRLVICNSVTRQYFPDSNPFLVAGSKFEDFVRAQAESGEVPQAVGRVEDWLRNRMRRHRLPENVITQQYSTGRWIQIIERRMSDGGTIGIRLDITELKKAEEERVALEAQLHHSQKLEALGTLAGGIAHDLNNTLVPVVALSKNIAKLLDPASRAHGQASLVHQAALRATDLVKQIVAFSRKQLPEKRIIDLSAVARDTIKMMRAGIPTTIKIETALSEVPPMIGDPSQLHQVILNLVTNAAQAIGATSGTISVALTPETEMLRLSVTDTGCGMDEATRLRIFEPFFTTKPVNEGTGLGMSVVHGIVMSHGGHIEVRSVLGHGSEIIVSLPPAPADREVASSEKAPAN
jgi:PAS domain S-box-containing protein